MFKVVFGDFVFIFYFENGYVIRVDGVNFNKFINCGIIYFYGIYENDFFKIILIDVFYIWIVDGKGGNGKGCFFVICNYDDGQCYEFILVIGDLEGIFRYCKDEIIQFEVLRCQFDF